MREINLDIRLLSHRIDELVEQNYLYRKFSPDGKLMLLCYTNHCIYDSEWVKATIHSRGHVYEVGTGRLIAKPFSKFFNLSELSKSKARNLIKKDFDCFEKLDGSLGIIYNYENTWRINTRRNFECLQTIEAERILTEKYDLSNVNKDLTILTEIIYPENRVILDYGCLRKIVLLASFNRTNGCEVSWKELINISNLTRIPLVKNFLIRLMN